MTNMSNKTTIIHSIPPDSRDVKTLYEVFSWGREAMAEYLYYGEIDSSAIKEDGTGDLTLANFHASVEVSFERDVLSVASGLIYNSSEPNSSPTCSFDLVGHYTPEQIIKEFGGDGLAYTIEKTSNSCTMFDATPWGNIILRYTAVDEQRVTEITVLAKLNFMSLNQMYEKLIELVQKYQTIPMNKFSGAIRE